MMKNYYQLVEVNHNPNQPYIPAHPYRILIIGSSGSSKANILLNLKVNDRILIKFINTSKIHSNRSINCLLTEERKQELKNSKAFSNYSQTIHDVYKNLEDYYSTKKTTVLIVFGDIIADMESNEKLNPIVTELF